MRVMQIKSIEEIIRINTLIKEIILYKEGEYNERSIFNSYWNAKTSSSYLDLDKMF